MARDPTDAAERHRELIRRFYDAFGRRDGDTMAACYLPTGRFHDPVFGTLTGEEAGRMWRMLTGRAAGLDLELLEHDADDAAGTARWRARYTFAATGRPVVNDVRARLRFDEGLIADHVDEFSFFGWSRQALGPAGLALGWSPPVRRLVRRRARSELAAFDR